MKLKDLRAIPFIGAWSQLKQNVPGFYGVGAALQKADANGKIEAVKNLYQNNDFFKTLVDNCEMAMQKSFFPLTRFLENHEIYGELWRKISDEYELTRRYLLSISGRKTLMADYPIERQSIEMRERIMLPLITVQQYALGNLSNSMQKTDASANEESYRKLVVRCSFGIINAGRNSV